MGYSIEKDGVSNIDLGMTVTSRPSIPVPEPNTKEITIPGRNGALHVNDGTYKDIVVPVELGFKVKEKDWMMQRRNALDWLDGPGTLRFSDYPGYFLKCKKVVAPDLTRTMKRIGKFKAEFTCYPHFFSDIGQQYISDPTELYNDGLESTPLFHIVGEGNCTITVNGYAFKANVGQELYIDTDLEISYRADKTFANTTVTGKYDHIRFTPGKNTISITSGFKLYVKPDWRFR